MRPQTRRFFSAAMTDPNTSSREIHFRESEPPQAIQRRLEHDLMARLLPSMEGGRLVYRGQVAVNGATCHVELVYEAALAGTNAYALRLEMRWPGTSPDYHEYHRKASTGWFDLWTRHFIASEAKISAESHPKRYAAVAAEAMAAESALAQPSDIQQEILRRLRAGATFSTAHKEGGTTISWRNGRFLRADHGESTHSESFPDDAAFLAFLRRFFEWETRRGSHGEPGEHDRWTLILRLLDRPENRRAGGIGGGAGGGRGGAKMPAVLAFLIAAVAVCGMALLAGHFPRRRPPVKLDTFDGRPPRVPDPPRWDRVVRDGKGVKAS